MSVKKSNDEPSLYTKIKTGFENHPVGVVFIVLLVIAGAYATFFDRNLAQDLWKFVSSMWDALRPTIDYADCVSRSDNTPLEVIKCREQYPPSK